MRHCIFAQCFTQSQTVTSEHIFNEAEAAKPALEPGDPVLQPSALLETNLQNLQTPFRLPKTIHMKDLTDV